LNLLKYAPLYIKEHVMMRRKHSTLIRTDKRNAEMRMEQKDKNASIPGPYHSHCGREGEPDGQIFKPSHLSN
jgi:hypothetical protein